MSVVRLLRVDGLSVHVRGVDMVDGTPALDLKPYVAAADSIPDAGAGWLTAPDPIAPFEVTWSDHALEQATWLRVAHGVDLVTRVDRTLALGPEPHPYRRIQRDSRGLRLAVKDWRVRFDVEEGRRIRVVAIETGYREQQLEAGTVEGIEAHRQFRSRFRQG